MAQRPNKNRNARCPLDERIDCRVPQRIAALIDDIVARSDYPITRSDVVRKLIIDALKAHASRRPGVPAAS